MKQKKQLVIQLVLLAASAALYAGTGLIRTGTVSESSGTADENAELKKIFSFDAEEIRSFSWTNGTDDFHGEKKEGAWTLPNHPELPLQVSRMEDIAEAVASLKALRTLPAEELSRYGLDTPARSLTVGTEDGKEYIIHLGNHATVDNAWYLTCEGDKSVYLAETLLPSMLEADILKFIRNESMPSILSPEKMTILKKDGTSVILAKPEHPEKYSYTDYYTWFMEEADGTYRPLDRGKAEDLVNKVLQVKWKACVNYDLGRDPEASAAYGFMPPVLQASVEGDDTSAVLNVGTDAGNGLVYAQPEGSVMAYTIDAEEALALNDASYDTLRPEDICRMDWGIVTGMTLESGENVRNIKISRNPDPASEQKYIYTENGNELAYSRVMDIRGMIDKMIPSGQLNDPDFRIKEDPVLRITFEQERPGYENMELEFYHYSDMYDLVRFNGETRQLISTHAAEAVIRLMERLDMPSE